MNHSQLFLAHKWIVAGMLAVSIGACGKSSDEPKPPPPAAPTKKETVFDDLIANKERARQQTERAMEENKQKLEAAMKKAEEAAQ